MSDYSKIMSMTDPEQQKALLTAAIPQLRMDIRDTAGPIALLENLLQRMTAKLEFLQRTTATPLAR